MELVESEMSLPVMAWLDSLGYVPYAEVPHYESCVDIVAVRDPGPVLIAVEMKTSLTKRVVGQAYMAGLFAEYSYCAVLSKPRESSLRTCRDRGVGVVRVEGGKVEILAEPEKSKLLYARSTLAVVARLRSRPPGGVAGKPALKGVGPAQDCARRVARWRREHPGSTWREIYANVENHYSSLESMRGALTSRGLV